MIERHDWTLTFRNSRILDSLDELLNASKQTKDVQKSSIKHESRDEILGSLREAQIIRKNLISLQEERISRPQWILVYILAIVLLITIITTTQSTGLIIGSVLKAALSSAVLFSVILLKKLNDLTLFDDTIGESSAIDVVEVIKDN